jgi:hypothetical protein
MSSSRNKDTADRYRSFGVLLLFSEGIGSGSIILFVTGYETM